MMSERDSYARPSEAIAAGDDERQTSEDWFLAAFASRTSCPQSVLEGLDFDALRKSAEGGHRDASFLLGLAHDTSGPLERSEAKAAALYEVAARQGHPSAQYMLGDMYEYGDGVTRDLEVAREWFLRAAEQGHTDAQCRLGNIYNHYTPESTERAEHWYSLAAHKGHASALLWLAGLVGKISSGSEGALKARMYQILYHQQLILDSRDGPPRDIAAYRSQEHAQIKRRLSPEHIKALDKLVGHWYSERYFG
jgi:TPR repeat protein